MLNIKKDCHYLYRAFSLLIESEFEIPELLSNDEISGETINIRLGYVPRKLDNPIYEDPYYEVEKDRFIFNISNVARYLVQSGNTIVVEPYDNAHMQDIRVYLLSTAIGVLLCQRGIVALHSSTIVVDHKAITFSGECGAGKSTLSLAFKNRGYGLLSDDISAIKIEADNLPYVYPSFPQQKLCSDILEQDALTVSKAKLIDKDRKKYAVEIGECFIKKPMLFIAFYELTISDGEELEVEELFGTEKLVVLLRNIYARYIIRDLGLDSKLLKDSLCILKNIPFYRIKRPENRNTVQEIVDLVLKNV
ncbi:hypothetical protein [Clostridium thermarum]|uniref:hypothetical protein n=1 Tax=Clostridium thermarum TaxID=1716543 RepID=UPI0013D01A23|nr:hypothetical protein [Clostridium thermarum]